MKYTNPKIKHKTICKNFREGGLKTVDVRNKLTSLQISWVKRLYGDCFHEWKIIPLYMLKKTFGTSPFHSNLSFNKSNLKKLLPFYRQMVISWSQYFSSSPETPSQVLSQFLWYNNYIKIEDAVIYFEKFSNKTINFLSKLFENGKIIIMVQSQR